jgi:F-box/WD-40 domain protein 7
VWNIETGQCMQILRGHVAAVRCVCFDGKYVVSGSYDFTIRVWNPFSNECLHVLEGHLNRVYSLLFDGDRIVSGSLDTTIIVWNVHTGSIIHKLTGHHSLTSGMQIKGDILVSGNADSTVKIWSLKTGDCMHTLSGYNKHMSAVTCLAFNDKFVVSSSDDGTVKLWNLETGEFIRNLLGLDSGGRGGVVWRISMHKNKLVCAVGSRIGVEETKLILLDFDWPPLDLTEKTDSNDQNTPVNLQSNNKSSELSNILNAPLLVHPTICHPTGPA